MRLKIYLLLIIVSIIIIPFDLLSFPKMLNDDDNWIDEYYKRICNGEVVERKPLQYGAYGGGRGDYPGVRLRRSTVVKLDKVTGQETYERFLVYDFKSNSPKKYKRESSRRRETENKFTYSNKSYSKEKINEKVSDTSYEPSNPIFLSDPINLYLLENLYLVKEKKSMRIDTSIFVTDTIVYPEITNTHEDFITVKSEEKVDDCDKNIIYVQLLLDEKGILRKTFLRNHSTPELDSLVLKTVESLKFTPAKHLGEPVPSRFLIRLVLSAERFYEVTNCTLPY